MRVEINLTEEVAVRRPDYKIYNIPKKKEICVLDWIYPIEDILTVLYYRDKHLDKIHNIKRDLECYIDGFTFCYDINNDIIEVNNIEVGGSSFGVYNNIKSLFNLNDVKTYQKILTTLESVNKTKIREIKFIKCKYDKDNINVDENYIPKQLLDNIGFSKGILEIHEDYSIWNSDGSLNEFRFDVYIRKKSLKRILKSI